jgi:hypothetical protein
MVPGEHPNFHWSQLSRSKEAQRSPFLSFEADKQFPQKRDTLCRSNFWHTNKGPTCSPVFYPRTSNSRSRGHRSWWQWPRGTYLSQPTLSLFLGRSGTGLVTQSAETSSCPIWLSSPASVCHSAAECHHNTCFCRQLLPFGNCHACGVDTCIIVQCQSTKGCCSCRRPRCEKR